MQSLLARIEEDAVLAEEVRPSWSRLQNPAPVDVFWKQANKQTSQKSRKTKNGKGRSAEACQPSTVKQTNNTNKQTNKTSKQTTKQIKRQTNLGRSAEACQPSTAKQSNMAERWSAEADEDRSAWWGLRWWWSWWITSGDDFAGDGDGDHLTQPTW